MEENDAAVGKVESISKGLTVIFLLSFFLSFLSVKQ